MQAIHSPTLCAVKILTQKMVAFWRQDLWGMISHEGGAFIVDLVYGDRKCWVLISKVLDMVGVLVRGLML